MKLRLIHGAAQMPSCETGKGELSWSTRYSLMRAFVRHVHFLIPPPPHYYCTHSQQHNPHWLHVLSL